MGGRVLNVNNKRGQAQQWERISPSEIRTRVFPLEATQQQFLSTSNTRKGSLSLNNSLKIEENSHIIFYSFSVYYNNKKFSGTQKESAICKKNSNFSSSLFFPFLAFSNLFLSKSLRHILFFLHCAPLLPVGFKTLRIFAQILWDFA